MLVLQVKLTVYHKNHRKTCCTWAPCNFQTQNYFQLTSVRLKRVFQIVCCSPTFKNFLQRLKSAKGVIKCFPGVSGDGKLTAKPKQ